MSVFIEISLVLILTTLVSLGMRALKQPLLVGYILTGILVGPSFLNLLHAHETIELFAKLGITILLFIVGLHLSPRVIKEVGKVSLVTGIGQVLFTSLVGFGLALMLGIDRLAALYVAIALTFSSTIIILKLLSDKGDVQSLYGKIAVGFLLVQDIIATLILLGVSSFATAGDSSVSEALLLTLGKGIVLLIGILLTGKWILPRLLNYVSQSSELLFLFSLTWGFGFAALFQLVGLSVEIGALIAGVVLSSTTYADEMSSRLRPLRDFFIILFFILLGANMLLTLSSEIILPAVAFSLFVLIGNPIIVIVLMNLLGYHRKTGFMSGLTVAQISEFSLILATLGMQVGHLSQEILTIITLVGLITIAGSTYLILYSERIYRSITPLIKLLELRSVQKSSTSKHVRVEAFVFGFNRIGHDFLALFRQLGYKVAVVDFDPKTESRLPKNYRYYYYGDVGNVEFLSELPLNSTQVAISTVPDLETNKLLVKYLQSRRSSIITIVFAQKAEDALELYQTGVSYVVLPHHLGAHHTVSLLKQLGFNNDGFTRRRDQHMKDLLKRIAI